MGFSRLRQMFFDFQSEGFLARGASWVLLTFSKQAISKYVCLVGEHFCCFSNSLLIKSCFDEDNLLAQRPPIELRE